MSYIELHARSAFSFLRGASQPEDLIEAALFHGMSAMALCDRDGVYGSPRLHAKARKLGLERALVGTELTLECGSVLPVLVKSRTGYQNLCRLITTARLRGTKQQSEVRWDELPQHSEGLVALTGDEEGLLRNPDRPGAVAAVDELVRAFGQENVFVEIQRHRQRGEEWRNQWLVNFARSKHLPLLATNGVLHAVPSQREALDVLTCMRHHTTLDTAGRLLSINAERHFKSATQMQELFADLPEATENTVRLADRLEFSLENLGYEFPKYAELPPGHSMDSFLRERAYAGAGKRYTTITPRVREQLEKELELIARLGFSGYFLIVWDLINYCQKHNILVQGRGSAANSVVCYCLEITACDPIKHELLFERFLTENRKSWPDIDLDLPSGDRREQVIQEVYQRYGKHGAAMTANVITYRGRSAMREIGKALSFPADTISRFSSLFANGDFPHTMDLAAQLRQAGLPEDHPRAAVAYRLYKQIYGLPRHLGQHSGGMIICQGALSSVVPLENASMPGRVVAQWDKDDCEDLGIIKVDLLGLGMMAALQDALAMCKERGHPIKLYEIQGIEDPKVYEMLEKADTIGTFQVESRAQMASLPRMKPKNFYEIAIQVAIIRPGPIQGGMLNSLYARREKTEEVSFLHPDFEPILKRTWGVPLFQEQLLAMAMKIADFSGAEAEELRRALSFHRSHERMDEACIKLRAAMERKQVVQKLADQIIQYVQSFAVYGFPESHAISFAMLAYASCWLKVNRAPEFYACLLNNMPMGFYSSATLIRDAKEHGVKVRPVSVLYSEWDCTIEEDDAIRLGLRMVRGLNENTGRLLAAERDNQFFSSLQDFRERVSLSQADLRTLARIGALNGLVEHRREGLWKIELPFLPGDLPGLAQDAEDESPLPRMDEFERLHADFAGTGVTTGKHPMALIREQVSDITRAGDLDLIKEGEVVKIGGLVICRQRPGTAKGIVFVSLEDETGVANAIVLPHVFERLRLTITQETFLTITGKLEKSRGTLMVQARQIEALDYGTFQMPKSHDFH